MQYIIMFLIVLGLAFADFVTGYIKAWCGDRVSSREMRKGGLHKVSELIIMLSAIGLTVGLEKLGEYYSDTRLAGLAGAFTALTVFVYIATMEIISIAENFYVDDDRNGMYPSYDEPGKYTILLSSADNDIRTGVLSGKVRLVWTFQDRRGGWYIDDTDVANVVLKRGGGTQTEYTYSVTETVS